MEASEKKALFRLLEDNDPIVVAAVNGKITELGQDILEALFDTYQKSRNLFIQNRILKLTDKIVENEILTIFDQIKLNDFADMELMAFCLSKIENPFLKKEIFLNNLRVIKNQIEHIYNQTCTPLNKIKALNHVIFNLNQYHYIGTSKPSTLSINKLLTTSKAAIESFMLLYLTLAKSYHLPLFPLDIEANPILAWRENNKEIFYINIGAKGAIVSQKQIEYYLEQKNLEQNNKYFKSVDLSYFLKQILKKMKVFYFKNNQFEKQDFIAKIISKI